MTEPVLPGDAPRRLENFLQDAPRAQGPERLGRLAVMHGCLTLAGPEPGPFLPTALIPATYGAVGNGEALAC